MNEEKQPEGKSKGFKVDSVSLEDMMDIWIESFHAHDNVLVIWSVKNHYKILEECGIFLNITITYNGKAITLVFDDIMQAFNLQDVISMAGCTAYMQVYTEGKLLSDNI